MSDYLWDKSGEPDEEVKRLETLLGEMRFEPSRQLELPPETNVFTRPRAHWYPALAVAAALALMILAGAWLAVGRRDGAAPSDAQVAENSAASATPNPTALMPAAPRGVNATAASGENESKINSSGDINRVAARGPERAGSALPRHTLGHRSDRDGLSRRAQLASNARRRKADSPEMIEAERAKEQLMLALHVASAKLNLAQRKAPGITDVAPGEPDRIER